MITTSPGRAIRDERRHDVVECAARRRPAPRTLRRIGRRERVDRDAGDRILAGGVDVGQHDVIGAGQRRTERVHQRRRPRVAVRLERDDDAAVERARRREHRRDLGRVMAVVVDDQNAVRLAAHLEAPLGAAELLQARGDPLERQAELQADRDGGQRVLQVVPAGHVQRQRAERRRGVGRIAAGADAPRDGRARRSSGPSTTSVAVTSALAASSP